MGPEWPMPPFRNSGSGYLYCPGRGWGGAGYRRSDVAAQLAWCAKYAALFDLSSFTGSLEITSTEPIVSLSLNFEAASVFSSLPPGEPDAAAQGSTTYYFTHLGRGKGLANHDYLYQLLAAGGELPDRFPFRSRQSVDGLVCGRGTVISRNDVLPPGGSVHQETNVELSGPLVRGWARVTCSGPVQASLLYRRRNSEGIPTGEAGVNAGDSSGHPLCHLCRGGEGQYGTGVAYANPSPTYRSLSPLLPGTQLGSCWPASFGHCHPEVMMRKIWRPCLVSAALPDRSKSPPRSPSSVCR